MLRSVAMHRSPSTLVVSSVALLQLLLSPLIGFCHVKFNDVLSFLAANARPAS